MQEQVGQDNANPSYRKVPDANDEQQAAALFNKMGKISSRLTLRKATVDGSLPSELVRVLRWPNWYYKKEQRLGIGVEVPKLSNLYFRG